RDLGPGQVYIPNATTSALHGAMIEHAVATNRVAILDVPDTATVATLTALADANDGVIDYSNVAKLVGPWVIGPGPETAPTSERTIPYGAIECGITARNDNAGVPCNQPPSGRHGISRWATDVAREWNADD